MQYWGENKMKGITSEEKFSSSMSCKVVRINVGGVDFKCYAKTLERFKGSLLASLDNNDAYFVESENGYFFDRNPVIFQCILDSYRTGSLHIPGDICGSQFKEELEFLGLSEYLVSQCCWDGLYKSEGKVQTIKTLVQFYDECRLSRGCKQINGFRQRIWRFLHEPQASGYAKMWSVFISFIIATSVIVSGVETVSYARTGSYSEAENTTFHRFVMLLKGNSTRSTIYFNDFYKKPHAVLPILDTFCFVVLTLELFLVFCFCPTRCELCKSWLHMSEVICSVAFWFHFVCIRFIDDIYSIDLIKAMVACKYITILKLVRLFRIASHFPALKLMGLTIRISQYELYVLCLMLFILTSLFGALMYVWESIDNNNFENVFTAMYWALITITTVGYGHYIPTTTVGHMIACACAVCGVFMLALPIGIFASNFNNLYYHHQYVSRHILSCRQHEDNHVVSKSFMSTLKKDEVPDQTPP